MKHLVWCVCGFSYAMPIIAFNIAATRKFIENKGNGILIENDVYALKKAIEKYIPFVHGNIKCKTVLKLLIHMISISFLMNMYSCTIN